MHPPSTPTTVRPAHALPWTTRLADYTMLTLALGLSLVSIGLFAWPSRPLLFPLGLSAGAAASWNAAMSFVFFAQHSITVRRGFRARLGAFIPARYDGAFYAITSGIALAVVVLSWQPTGPPLFVLQGPARWVVQGAAVLAIAAIFWGVFSLPGFDMCGLRPIRAHLRGAPPSATTGSGAKPLVVRGPYRFVRHPLYTSIIVLMWADPEMSAGRLAVAALWTAWIYVGARLEEGDLIADFGDRYLRYQQQVPILVPWRKPVDERVDDVTRT